MILSDIFCIKKYLNFYINFLIKCIIIIFISIIKIVNIYCKISLKNNFKYLYKLSKNL